MKLTIIRHAEPDYDNNTLTEKGFLEADYLGKYLKDEKIDYVYSSPLNRAKFTADGIIKYNSLKRYEQLDFLREFEPFNWDKLPSYLNSSPELFDKEKAMSVNEMGGKDAVERFQYVNNEFSKLLKKHGYEKNGVYFNAIKPNYDHIVLVCHFGLESYLLSYLFNVSPVAFLNFSCAQPSSVTTVVTEEREKGKATFRLLTFGSVEHLKFNGEPPSFMARFAEVYGNGDTNLT